MDQPLVSVCLITYNHGKYIRQAIDSILMQEVNFPWEIIIADDASSDQTQKIIREYHQKYPDLIKPNLRKNNIGAGSNFIELIGSAKGKFIAYLEGDDYWTDPFKLQKQVGFLEGNPSFSLVAGGYTCKRENTEEDVLIGDSSLFNQINEYGFEFELDVFNKMWVFKTLTIVFRNNLDFVKLTTKYNYFRDAHLFYHILKNGKGFYFQKVFGVYNIHEGGVHSLIGEIQQAKIAYKVYRELYFNNDKDHILREKYFNCTLTAIVLYDRGKYITGLMLVKKFSEFLQLHKTLLKVLFKL